jgi:uncharacterized protein YjbJ (UPF0337 family)
VSILDKVKDLFGGAKEKIEEITGQEGLADKADKAEETGRNAAENAKDKLPGTE